MPTIKGEVTDRKILLDILVWETFWDDNPADELSDIQDRMKSYTALVDTGAQISSITQKVVDELGLTDDGWESITGVHGSEDVPVYTVDMASGVMYSERNRKGETVRSTYSRILWNNPVTLMGISPPDFDIIFGMDVLRELHITVFRDEFTLSI